MQATLFSELGLSAEVQRAVQKLGFEQASPIQAAAIPVLLGGRDVVGQSHTGSGKTAAFAIPAIERLDLNAPGPQALILCPTRELAMQVTEEVHKLACFKRGVRAVPIYGGASYTRQFAELRGGAQVVVGTPGRLLDHMRRGTLNLKNIRTVILDEADEMLNMGFRDDIETLLKDSPSTRQTVLFSATVPRAIEELISRYTKDPARIRMESPTLTVPTVEQVCFEVDRRWKFEALTRLIDLHDITLGIVFANTQRDVVDLADHLVAAGYGAESIHGGMPQNARERVMQKFRRRQTELLVATDVAARGIDVEDIQAVINFDLPYDPEDYVHRIGRTGRAGRHGLALSLMSGREVFLVRDIERLTRQRLRRGQIPTIGEIEDAKQNQCLRDVRETLKAGDFRHYDHLLEVLLEEGFDSLDVASALIHHMFARAKAAQAANKAEKAGQSPDRERPQRAADERPQRPMDERPARPVRKPAPATPRVPAAPRAATPTAASRTAVSADASAAAVTGEAPAPVVGTEAVAASEAAAAVVEGTAPGAAEAGSVTSNEGSPAPAPTPRPRPQATQPPRPAPAPRPARPMAPRPDNRFGAPQDRMARPDRPMRPDRPDRGDRPQRPDRPMGAPMAPRPERPVREPRLPQAPRPTAAPDAPEGAPKPVLSPEELAGGRAEVVSEYTRLWLSVGEEHGADQKTLREFILGTTGEPAESIRHVDVRPRHSFAEVPTLRASAVLGQLKRAPFGDQRLKVKVA
jgi:ATP-dependent RNA helicase DeaD